MENKLKSIIAEIKENPDLINTLTSTSSITSEAGLTSLEMVTFIFKVEEEFDVEVDFDSFDYTVLQSIQKFCDFIVELKKTQSA
jgi:acyl carrier protein